MLVKNQQIISESEMVNTYIGNLKLLEGDKILIFKEVKNNQKRIDLVQLRKYNNRFGTAHALEFKVFNWKKGFGQTLGNRVLIPYNSLAIWKDYEDKVDRDMLINEGIGLIIVTKDKNIIELKPKKSKYLIQTNYQKIRYILKKQIND